MEDKDLELLDQYLRAELSDEDNMLVENRLSTDLAFKSLFQNLQNLAEASNKYELREKIKAIQEEKIHEWRKLEKPKTKFTILKWSSVAAAACLAGVLYLTNADFTTPSVINLQERGNSAQSNDEAIYVEFLEANKLLEAKKYSEAAKLFSQVAKNKDYATYYREMSSWYEIVAISNVDEDKAKELLLKFENKPLSKYEVPELEKLKMRLRLLF